MEICSHIGLSTDKIKDIHRLSMNTPGSTHAVLSVLSVDELSADVTKFLKIQDATEEDLSSSLPHQSCEFQENDTYVKSHCNQTTTPAPEKCLSKCATFSSSSKTLSPQNAISSELLIHGDNNKSLDPSGLHSTPTTTHMKPVSAMKGSREKRGVAPPVKLTVKWAPDVYDPIPTSVSHVTTNNRSSRHSKKNSRNKQKSGSKSSKGSKGKDKKQVRKRGGNSNSSGMGYKMLDYEEEMVDFRQHEPRIDFHVGNPDQLCGSSFLKRYGTSLHLSSVAEAT
ncbi:uncharacterized protein [Rutidosis leptorrhynchoides]|uniref:uncharacterized protein n=1 Tax=Rutidosis leptorrhynchoides TaxID=125765 RepID=UPI003A98CF32